MSSPGASISKIFRTSMWNKKARAIVLLVLVLPVAVCEKGPSPTRSNSISKLRDNSKIEDFTSSPKIGCGACKVREEIKRRSLEVIKVNLLKKMGFQTAPNVTGRVLPQVPSHILAMVEQGYTQGIQSDEPQFAGGSSDVQDEDDFHAKPERFLSYAQPYPRLRHSWRGHDILHFTFSDNLLKYYVGNATLYVYVKGVERRPLPSFYVEVFKVYKGPDHSDTPGMVKIASRRVTQPLGRGEWVKIDVTVMVSEWFKSPRDNYGFILNGTVNGRKVIVTDSSHDGASKVPFAEITTTGAKRRARRNMALFCDDKMNEPLCCRYPLTVNFYELGMEFVIAPKSYEANYCAGECPPVTLQDYPHTHLRQMASPNSIAPCCTPRKVSAISMLYYDNYDNVIYGSLSGMVVDRCGCL